MKHELYSCTSSDWVALGNHWNDVAWFWDVFWFRFLVQKYEIWLEKLLSGAQHSTDQLLGRCTLLPPLPPLPPRYSAPSPPTLATALHMIMGASDPFFMGVSDTF